jgi:phospholipase C
MVIVEENRDRSEVIGSPSMPYLNSLATTYGNTAAWHGVSHPSLPNYLALISGSTQGVSDDGCGYSFSGVPTLGSQLTLAGIRWKAYLEGLPSAGSTICESGEYVKKHNPFAYFPQTNGPNVVPASQFTSDLSGGKLPSFVFYVPNLCNDGHDCSNTTVDNYLKGLIPGVLASPWYAENGTIIITYDEGVGEGKIATVVLHGRGAAKTLTAAGDHYGTLATIEDLYGVPRLGLAASATTTLAPLLK